MMNAERAARRKFLKLYEKYFLKSIDKNKNLDIMILEAKYNAV